MENLKVNITGHVLIKDIQTGDIVLNQNNDIHKENMSVALVSVLENTKTSSNNVGIIKNIVFGNGGTETNDEGNINYRHTRVNNISDTLYNEIFHDGSNSSDRISIDNNLDDDSENNVISRHIDGESFSDIVITCTLNPIMSEFVFDELGLLSNKGRLLTHLIFRPITKNSNRKFEIIYTLRFSITE